MTHLIGLLDVCLPRWVHHLGRCVLRAQLCLLSLYADMQYELAKRLYCLWRQTLQRGSSFRVSGTVGVVGRWLCFGLFREAARNVLG